MERDADGFYSRLGFAYIGENVLAVEYKFAYTSSGGLAQRSFTIPMTEGTIVELIKTLESKLTASAFAKEQRTLMTSKLRDFIKARDNYTCCFCGNSTHPIPCGIALSAIRSCWGQRLGRDKAASGNGNL